MFRVEHVTVGTMTFGPVEIAYDAGVLEPRPWTLEQARWAVEVSSAVPDGPVLELCCGAGQIGLVVGVETGRPLVQVDDDEDACGFARRNADVAGIATDVRCAPIETAVAAGERFPIVIADPPYIPSGETAALADDPDHAIDGGADGLAVARRCLKVAAAAVAPGGVVLVQTGGPEQAAALAAEAHFAEAEIRTFAPDRAVLLLRGIAGRTTDPAP
jgi:methylase of polypeptide subunit release factors